MNILITGSAQGIGLAIAAAVAEGNNLILLDLQEDKLKMANDRLSKAAALVTTHVVDLTNVKVIEALQHELSTVDVLINNAGYAHKMMPVEELDAFTFDLTFNLNVRAPFLLTKLALPGMKLRKNGWVINIASSANIWGYVNHSLYASSKSALISFTESVAKEVENTGVKAISILPSRTNTDMNKRLRGDDATGQSPDAIGETIARIITGGLTVKNGDDVRVKEGTAIVETNIYDNFAA